MARKKITRLRLILGDQLNARHAWFKEKSDSTLYVMMEVRSETDYVLHHAQKIISIFAAMRAFAAALEQAGHRVCYWRIGDKNNHQNFIENLRDLIAQHEVKSIERQHADEYRLEQMLLRIEESLGVQTRVVSSEHFLVDGALLQEKFLPAFKKAVPRMEFFYRDLRKRYGILLQDNGAPEGNQWNFDSDNRKPWRGDPPLQRWPQFNESLESLWQEIQAAGVKSFGSPHAEKQSWPITRAQAEAWFDEFINKRLVHFGQYQDAMTVQSTQLFHSGISFALNTKMLHPLYVIKHVENAYRQGIVDLPAAEGFIRQVLGWREYVRVVYWARMPEYAQTNALGHHRKLPDWYWTGKTNMRCLQHAITQSLDSAYAHHIQRLMITGNFALLAGIHPDEVDAWYLGIYIDAFEWVEMPNTRGMSQFADGGCVASKPYAGSASYIRKMSDYCKGCHYKSDLRHGENACPFNSLYWHFFARHAAHFSKNPRVGMAYKTWEKLGADERSAVIAQAEDYLSMLNSL